MKKIKLFILLMLVSFPMLVSADAAGPMLTQYDIRISNKNGAIIYKWDDKTDKYTKTNEVLKYDQIYTVINEKIEDKQLYGILYEYNEEGEYSNEYIIKLSDAKPLKYNLDDYKQETSQKYYVFEEGVILYQGPSKIYNKVSPEKTIPVGTIIETKHYDGIWAYINYKGTKGWIYVCTDKEVSPYNESSGVAELKENETVSFKTIGPVDLYTTPKSNKKVGITIPKNADIINQKVIATYMDNPNNNYYIEYNGTKGWIRLNLENSNVALIDGYSEPLTIVDTKGINLYDNPNDSKNIIDNIPYLTKLTQTLYHYYKDYRDYDSDYWIQVTYNGKIGWINDEKNYIKDTNQESKRIIFAKQTNEEKEIKIQKPEGLIIYEDLNNLNTQISTIPYKARVIPTLYIYAENGTWYFVEYEEQEGWIYLSDEEDSSTNDNGSSQLPPSSNNEIPNNSSSSTESVGKKILSYISIVVIVSLTAFVTLILINKQKKDNNATE